MQCLSALSSWQHLLQEAVVFRVYNSAVQVCSELSNKRNKLCTEEAIWFWRGGKCEGPGGGGGGVLDRVVVPSPCMATHMEKHLGVGL